MRGWSHYPPCVSAVQIVKLNVYMDTAATFVALRLLFTIICMKQEMSVMNRNMMIVPVWAL